MKFVTVALLSAFFAALTPAQQDRVPNYHYANGFYDACAVAETNRSEYNIVESLDSGYCIGFASGFTQGIRSAEVIHRIDKADRIFCLPSGVDNVQIVKVVRKYIGDHPERSHLPIEGQFVWAMHDAFPCAK